VTSVTISCNPDGSVHWVATVLNSGDCTAVVPYKSQLQITQPSSVGGGWLGVVTERDTASFPPGTSTVSGDFCYQFPPDTQRIRVEFSIDTTERDCRPRKKSHTMEPCLRTDPCVLDYSDVSNTNAFFNYVMGAKSEGIVSGYTDGTFRPDALTTRAQLAKMAVVAFGLSLATPESARFSDVAVDNPFYAYIEAAYAAGWVSGYADGTFRPYANVTRGQVAKVIVTASGLKLLNPAQASFSDVGAGSTYYRYVETALAAGILSGYPDGTFRPSAPATRGQIAKITFLAAFPPQE
jgi:hypothetical protein